RAHCLRHVLCAGRRKRRPGSRIPAAPFRIFRTAARRRWSGARRARVHVRQGRAGVGGGHLAEAPLARPAWVHCWADGNTPIAPPSRPNFSAIIQCLWNRRAFPWGFPMLVARRDPPFHSDAGAPLNPNSPLAPRASKLPRFVMFMQLFGSLVAVLVGIGSGYSFYRANFSPEATCQTLRSSIIALLDKSVDAAA